MIYEEIFREFESVGVRYLVVEGMAVNLFGYGSEYGQGRTL